jgi:ribose 5-phosphate isomerase B
LEKYILAVGGDHAGFSLKGPLIKFLLQEGHAVEDCGSYNPDPVDFPDITQKVCELVRTGKAQKGILVCGTGVGACIAANKVRGIRAVLLGRAGAGMLWSSDQPNRTGMTALLSAL